MEPTREQMQKAQDDLAVYLETAIGAGNGRTKVEIITELFGEDTPETRRATAMLVSQYKRRQLKANGRMYVTFRRDGAWKTAQIAEPDEGFEIATGDARRVLSGINGLADRVKFLVSKQLLNADHIAQIETTRRIMGTALLTPISLPQITAPMANGS